MVKLVSDTYKICLNHTKDSSFFFFCLEYWFANFGVLQIIYWMFALDNRSIVLSFNFLIFKTVILMPTLKVVKRFKRENVYRISIIFLRVLQVLKRLQLFLHISPESNKTYFTLRKRIYVQSSYSIFVCKSLLNIHKTLETHLISLWPSRLLKQMI